jgi:hypothetical protein
MIFHEPRIEVKIHERFLPVTGLESVKEGDVFRTVGKDGQPIISKNLWIDGKYYASIHSWRAISDSMIDVAGRYNVEAVPEEAYLGIIKYGDTTLVAPTPKKILGSVFVGITDIVGIGLVAPFLISATSTLSVIAGFGVIGGCLLLTGAHLFSFFQKGDGK